MLWYFLLNKKKKLKILKYKNKISKMKQSSLKERIT